MYKITIDIIESVCRNTEENTGKGVETCPGSDGAVVSRFSDLFTIYFSQWKKSNSLNDLFEVRSLKQISIWSPTLSGDATKLGKRITIEMWYSFKHITPSKTEVPVGHRVYRQWEQR